MPGYLMESISEVHRCSVFFIGTESLIFRSVLYISVEVLIFKIMFCGAIFSFLLWEPNIEMNRIVLRYSAAALHDYAASTCLYVCRISVQEYSERFPCYDIIKVHIYISFCVCHLCLPQKACGRLQLIDFTVQLYEFRICTLLLYAHWPPD